MGTLMALASLPPAIEIRDFRRNVPIRFATELFWCQADAVKAAEGVSWKTVAFSRISDLEYGKQVAGAGDFRASEQAAGQLRLYLNRIPLKSLPIPSVVPLSGRGIMLTWQSGVRAVEVTSFADGEIVLDALENDQTKEELSDRDAESVLAWLVNSSEIQRPHATAR
jgi:hypothetical protein